MQGQRGLITRKAVVSLSYMGEDWNKGTQNKQMLSSAINMCIIQLLSYSVEEAYCSLGFDFARVGSSRSDREKLPTDEEFHIRWGFFSYGKKETADMNSAGIVQLIGMLSFSFGLAHNRSGSNCFAEVVKNQASPYFLLDIIQLFRVKMS